MPFVKPDSVLAEYYRQVVGRLEEISLRQSAALEEGGRQIAEAIARDRLIFIFGCGHSHLLAEEGFYRAGGLANVCPILDPPLMLHEGAVASSRLEKQPGLAAGLLDRYPAEAGDILICVSTSGINAVPVEMALAGRERGMFVVGITSSQYLSAAAATGHHLSQCCDLWLDNCAPYGDACLQAERQDTPFAPVSTLTSAFLLNALLAHGITCALARGCQPPVYRSGNLPGGSEYNQALIRRFCGRIRHL